MPFLVRFRPNSAYLALLAVGVGAVGLGFSFEEPFRVILVASGALFVAVLGLPLLVSTVLRVPLLAVGEAGVRLPVMGVRLEWADVVAVRQAPGPTRTVLLIVPRDPHAVLSQMRPWLRAECRRHIARYGTPIVVSPQSLDRTFKEIQSAVARFHPISDTRRPLAEPSVPLSREPESDSRRSGPAPSSTAARPRAATSTPRWATGSRPPRRYAVRPSGPGVRRPRHLP